MLSRTTVQYVTPDYLGKQEIAEKVCLFDKDFSEGLKDDNFVLDKEEVLVYEDQGLKEYKNNNINFIKPNPKNMNHAVEQDDYDDDAYDQLFSAKLLLQWIDIFVVLLSIV